MTAYYSYVKLYREDERDSDLKFDKLDTLVNSIGMEFLQTNY